MMSKRQPSDTIPDARDLYRASLIAAAMVFAAAVLILAALAYFSSNGGGWPNVVQTLLIIGTLGTVFGAFATVALIAPLGTAIGSAVLRLTPPAWWQGPLTGMLVAIMLEALVLALFARFDEPWDAGSYVTLALPIVLALFAGAYVQHRILRWPAGRTAPSLPS